MKHDLGFIPASEALQISGHPSTVALDRWARRYEARFPDGPAVLRRHGAYDRGALLNALLWESTAKRRRTDAAISRLRIQKR